MGEATAANYKQLVTLSFQLKQHDDVLAFASKLKQLDPSEKISYYIGKVQYEQDNYGEAIKSLNDAREGSNSIALSQSNWPFCFSPFF